MNRRLADILLRSLDPKYGPVRERVRAAEKFVIEPASIKLVGDHLVGTDPRFAQSLLRLPFQNTWIETRQGERARAWLIEATDNSYVRADVICFVNRQDIDPDRSIGMNPHVYAVDFGQITVSTERPIRYDGKFIGAGSGSLISDGVLFAVLSAINFPHAIVEREDHTITTTFPGRFASLIGGGSNIIPSGSSLLQKSRTTDRSAGFRGSMSRVAIMPSAPMSEPCGAVVS